MKSKLFIATAASLAIAIGAFAKGTETKAIAVKNLKSEFGDAANVTWSNQKNLTEATFEWNGQKLHAFYDADGEQVALSREIGEDKLPLKALQAIKTQYTGYTTTEAIEYNSTEEGLSYYVSLENNNKKTILRVSPEGSISSFK